jgi:REP element-mobilizing transposase RayT
MSAVVPVVGRARPPGAPRTTPTRPQRKKLLHDIPLSIRPDTATFFITICCAPKDEDQLCRQEIAAGIFNSVAFRQSRCDWWMELLLLMPDHLHALVSFPSGNDMTTVISQWKEYLAKKLGIRWQTNFFDHRLRNDQQLREKVDYILQNPVRRGLVQRLEDWPYAWMTDHDRGAPGGRALPTLFGESNHG